MRAKHRVPKCNFAAHGVHASQSVRCNTTCPAANPTQPPFSPALTHSPFLPSSTSPTCVAGALSSTSTTLASQTYDPPSFRLSSVSIPSKPVGSPPIPAMAASLSASTNATEHPPDIPTQSASSPAKYRDQRMNHSSQSMSDVWQSKMSEDQLIIHFAGARVHGSGSSTLPRDCGARWLTRRISRSARQSRLAQPSHSVENASDPVRPRRIADFLEGRQRIRTRIQRLRAAWMEWATRRGCLRVRNIP